MLISIKQEKWEVWNNFTSWRLIISFQLRREVNVRISVLKKVKVVLILSQLLDFAFGK